MLLHATALSCLLALGACAGQLEPQETEDAARWFHSLLPASLVGQNPFFCKWYDCPAFTVTDKNEFYETRAYGVVNWVTCPLPYNDVSSRGWEQERRACFWALFNYISGDNAASRKITMTVPVVERFGKNITPFMGFFIPGSSIEVPAPNNGNLTVVTQLPTSYYVRSFTGFGYNPITRVDNWRIQTEVLNNVLQKQGKKWGSTLTAAGYDSPWTILFRHNEVWTEAYSVL